ncbi:MAG TPA: hypothetical protein VFQ91_29045 [Bryobacteraceae bacterium]|nr:hypothetical protein [Bryobacteraceae bacterium]
MNAGALIVLFLIAAVGYYLVSFLISRFQTRAGTQESLPENVDAVYARMLGVRSGASMPELEEALQRAIDAYAPEHVGHMRPEDQQIADIRLRQAHRAFHYLSQRLQGIETPELPPA